MRKFALLFAAAALIAGALDANAANTTNATNSAPAPRCRDAQGHFIRCPTPAATSTPQRCRNARGQYIRCPTGPNSNRCRNAQGQFIACPTTGANTGAATNSAR